MNLVMSEVFPTDCSPRKTNLNFRNGLLKSPDVILLICRSHVYTILKSLSELSVSQFTATFLLCSQGRFLWVYLINLIKNSCRTFHEATISHAFFHDHFYLALCRSLARNIQRKCLLWLSTGILLRLMSTFNPIWFTWTWNRSLTFESIQFFIKFPF